MTIIEGNSPDDSKPGDLLNKYTTSEFVRLGYTYFIFIGICILLIKFQPELQYQHKFIMSGLYITFTIIVEIIWMYAFSQKLREEQKKEITARDTFHTVLNNALPMAVLVFGYAILIDAFRSSGFSSDGEHVEFYIRGITSLIFIVAYMYLFYNLIKLLDEDNVKKSMNGTPYEEWDKDYPDQKGATNFDRLLDILYNLFQPMSILVIAGIMYFIIRVTNAEGGMDNIIDTPPGSKF